MMFEKGFVHTDPHPGNMFVRYNKKKEMELVLLDHGNYTEMKHDTRIAYAKLWRGVLS